MRKGDFFKDELDEFGFSARRLNGALLEEIRTGTGLVSDIDAAVPLAHLVHDEFQAFGTDGSITITNDQAREAVSALRTVLRRLGIEFNPPFIDFDRFRSYWLKKGASGSWQARRDLLYPLFDPLHELLADLQADSLRSSLASPAGSRSRTGWLGVDEEVVELRRHFQEARTPQDYRNVGNDCVAVLERLSAEAYNSDRHLHSGEDEPPVASTKARLERVIEVELVGPANAELRKLARAAIEQAQAVKHRTPNRQQAGIAADSVILLVSMFRRLVDPNF